MFVFSCEQTLDQKIVQRLEYERFFCAYLALR